MRSLAIARSAVVLLLLLPHFTAPLSQPAPSRRHVIVVGGGWAGYTTAAALSTSSDCSVTLLEASPRATGGLAGGWRTKGGRPIEAGIHGFWREYQNTFAEMRRAGVDPDSVLSDFTPSVLFSKNGRVATAPVLAAPPTTSSQSPSPTNPNELLGRLAALLPAPLDTALLADFDADRLSPLDRASAVGLLGAWADFEQEGEASWALYDKISAERLFKGLGGVSPKLYDELVSPLLHVLPMAPGFDTSAAGECMVRRGAK